ncbi:MAG TPA: hypothetical protein VIH71_13365 [Solirubrobacteraceae bacterium]
MASYDGAYPRGQPELSNEVPLPVSDLAAGLLFGEDPPLLAAGVEVLPLEDDPLELVGVFVTGASVTGAGVVTAAGETDVDSAEDSATTVVPVLPAAVLSMKTGGGGALITSMLTGDALLSATGIAVPAAAAGTLGSSRSAGTAAGRSARPIAKQQANTPAPASTDTSAART